MGRPLAAARSQSAVAAPAPILRKSGRRRCRLRSLSRRAAAPGRRTSTSGAHGSMTAPMADRHPQWFDPAMPSREQCVLPALLAARAAATPDREYLLYEDGKRWTYGQTYSLARRAAAALRRRGVRAGDKVL